MSGTMTQQQERITIVGDGNVGRALAHRLLGTGHDVCFAIRTPTNDQSSTHRQGAQHPGSVDEVPRLPLEKAMSAATMIFLAVPASAAATALRFAPSLKDVVVVDCTNPLKWDNGPVVDAPAEGSIAQKLAAEFPDAIVCKGFNHFGAEILADPALMHGPADMYIVSDDQAAKARVIAVAGQMGFTGRDAGPLRNASLLEHLAVLWIHLATVGGAGRTFAFRQEAQASLVV